MPLEEVLVRYDADMKEITKDFANLKKQITGIDQTAATSAKKTEASLNSLDTTVKGKLSNSFKNLGAGIAAAFSIRVVTTFINESLKLANAAHDIKASFEQLNDPLLLNRLRDAVKGTLDDVTLMKKAIEAKNLGIPLASLAKSFEFAKLRADQTNGSVSQLIDNITTGIGRQSTRSLVNLGVSTERFNAEVQKSGDYFTALSKIIDEELGKAGEQIEDTGDKVEQMQARIINLQTEVGEKLLPLQDLWLSSLLKIGNALTQVFDPKGAKLEEFRENLIAANLSLADQEKQLQLNLKEMESIRNIPAASAQQLLIDRNRLKSLELQNQVLEESIRGLKTERDETVKTTKTIQTKGDTYKYTTTQLEKYIEEIQKAFEPLNFLSESFTEAELAIQEAKQEMMEFVIASGELSRGETRDGARRVEQLTDQIEQVEDYGKTWQETMLNIVDQTGQAFAIIDDIQNRSTQNRIDQLDLWLEQGKITQRAYDDLRKRALEKEAKQEKLLTLFSIGLELAKAIASLNVIGIIGSSIQLGLVASEPIPKFKKGVVGIKGPGTETSDEILARLSKGESVVTAKGTKQDVGLFKAANKLKLPEYINENYVLPQLKLQMAQHKKEQGEIAKALKNLKNNFDDSDMIRTMFEQMNVQKDGVKKIVNAMKSNHSIRRNY